MLFFARVLNFIAQLFKIFADAMNGVAACQYEKNQAQHKRYFFMSPTPLQTTNINKVPCNTCCGCHRRANQMSTPACTLTAFEIAVRG